MVDISQLFIQNTRIDKSDFMHVQLTTSTCLRTTVLTKKSLIVLVFIDRDLLYRICL